MLNYYYASNWKAAERAATGFPFWILSFPCELSWVLLELDGPSLLARRLQCTSLHVLCCAHSGLWSRHLSTWKNDCYVEFELQSFKSFFNLAYLVEDIMQFELVSFHSSNVVFSVQMLADYFEKLIGRNFCSFASIDVLNQQFCMHNQSIISFFDNCMCIDLNHFRKGDIFL